MQMVYLTYLLRAINFNPQEFASKSEQKLSRLYLSGQTIATSAEVTRLVSSN